MIFSSSGNVTALEVNIFFSFKHHNVFVFPCASLSLDIICLTNWLCLIVVLNQLFLQVLPLCNHDLMLLFHLNVVLNENLFLLYLDSFLQFTWLFALLDLLEQFSLVCVGCHTISHIFTLDLILMTKVVSCMLFGENFLKLFVLQLFILGLVWHVFHIS